MAEGTDDPSVHRNGPCCVFTTIERRRPGTQVSRDTRSRWGTTVGRRGAGGGAGGTSAGLIGSVGSMVRRGCRRRLARLLLDAASQGGVRRRHVHERRDVFSG